MYWLAKIFKPDYKGLSAPLALLVLELILIDFVFLVTNRDTAYMLSAIFGTLFVGLSDPGGAFKRRVGPMAFTSAAGALLTALGFSLDTAAWGWITLVAFGVTLLSGLSLKFGLHRFITTLLLNVWFVVALGIGSGYSQSHIATNTWGQALAWLGGGALWFVVALVLWLLNGRTAHPLVADIPTDNTERPLTKPVVAFAVLRALALAVAVAIPAGLTLEHGYWIPIATLIAMKTDLTQGATTSLQRLVGAAVGAGLAALLLWAISNKLQLVIIALILLANGVAIRFVNYAWYCAAIAAGALTASGLFQPTSHTAEWERVWYTFIGLSIGMLVTLLATIRGKQGADVSPQSQ
ncbi:MAG TPA: FUSC family protein [Candidatus Saccharimonadales bacterium]|nr:FUSC family protein [Candidatus Saccharimonadales bacterium]